MANIKYSKRWEEVGADTLREKVHCQLVVETSINGEVHSEMIAMICERLQPTKLKSTNRIRMKEAVYEEKPCYFGVIRIANRWVVLGSCGYVSCDKITLDEMKKRVEDHVAIYYAVEYRNAKNKFKQFEQEWQKISTVFNYELEDDANGTMGKITG